MSDNSTTVGEQAARPRATRLRRPGGGTGTGRGRSLAAWALVAGWGAWTIMRAAGGDRLPGSGALAAPLLAMTPYVTAAVPVPVIAALILRRRGAAAAALVIALALPAMVLPRTFGADQPVAGGPAVRVLSVNVHYGGVDARALVDLVGRTRPDVLSLQELTPAGMRRYERAGLTRLLPHKVVRALPGAAGTGLYSRHPLRELPPVGGTRMATSQAGFTLPGGRRVQVTGVHPVPPIGARAYGFWRHDIAALPPAARGEGPERPVRILAGDFNATLDHATFRHLIGRGYADAAARTGDGLVPTWGTGSAPPLTLDHILVDRDCAVTEYAVHDVAGTDHRAVFAEINLP